MAKIITDDQHYENIANAIRERNDETTLYKPSEMADAVRNLSSLNFKIVSGTTQPDDPKENMIWVITPNEITSWAFDATEPENPEEGMIWFPTGTSSIIKFNALKESTIMVCPFKASQYLSGIWSEVTAMIYQEGEWKDWSYYLYINGNECANITGGFSFAKGSDSSQHGTGTGSKNSSSMSISTTGAQSCCVYTSKKIDITSINTIKFDVTPSRSGLLSWAGIRSTVAGGWVAQTSLLTSGINSVDVSNVTGECYVVVYLVTGYGESTASVTIKSIEAE